MVTRRVMTAGEVIGDAETGLFPGFFAYVNEGGERVYASYSDWCLTEPLRAGQRVEFVSITRSWFWGRVKRTRAFARPAASGAGHSA